MQAIEQTALHALTAGDHPALAALRAQFEAAAVVRRRCEGGTWHAELQVEPGAPSAGLGNAVLADVWLDVAGLVAGAAAELWIIDGRARALDLTTDGEVWPDNPRVLDAWYGRPSEADPDRLERTRERDLRLVSRGRSA